MHFGHSCFSTELSRDKKVVYVLPTASEADLSHLDQIVTIVKEQVIPE